MNKIKLFNIFQNTLTPEGVAKNLPTHRLSADIGGSLKEVAVGWRKVSAKGTNYIMGSMSNEFANQQDPSKSTKAYCIVDEKELDMLIEELTLYKQGALKPVTSAGTKVPDFSEVDEKNDEPPF